MYEEAFRSLVSQWMDKACEGLRKSIRERLLANVVSGLQRAGGCSAFFVLLCGAVIIDTPGAELACERVFSFVFLFFRFG